MLGSDILHRIIALVVYKHLSVRNNECNRTNIYFTPRVDSKKLMLEISLIL